MGTTQKNKKRRYMMLTFRGFEGNVHTYTANIQPAVSICRQAGESWTKDTKLPKSFFTFKWEFETHEIWDHAIGRFFEYLGGVEHIRSIVDDLKPEEVTQTIRIPVRRSVWQEDRYISQDVLGLLASLNMGVAFQFA